MRQPRAGSFADLCHQAQLLEPRYARDDSQWDESPFAWIRSLPSRSEGAAGEALLESWLTRLGYEVSPAGTAGADRCIAGVRVEIKTSTLWRCGTYRFSQLRDQDWEHVLLFGLSPRRAHLWIVPKAVALRVAIPQHRGKDGVDTRWLEIDPAAPPDELADLGGPVSRVRDVLEQTLGCTR